MTRNRFLLLLAAFFLTSWLWACNPGANQIEAHSTEMASNNFSTFTIEAPKVTKTSMKEPTQTSTQTPIQSPIPTQYTTSEPSPDFQVEVWDGLKPGWMSFSGISYVVGALYDPQGYIWAATSDRIFRWGLDNEELEDMTPEDGLPGTIQDILIHKDSIWVTASEGIANFSGNAWDVYKLKTEYVYRFSDTRDRLWAATSEGRVYYFEGEEWLEFDQFPEESYRNYSYVSVVKSKDGSYWFINYEQVERFDGQSWKAHDDLRYISSSVVQEDGTVLFIFPNQIVSFDGKDFNPIELPQSRFSYPIENLIVTVDGSVWFQSYGEDAYIINNGVLSTADPLNHDYDNQPENASYEVLAKIPSGWIFQGINNSIFLYDNEDWREFSFASAYSPIEKIVNYDPIGFSPEGALWILVNGVPARFDGENIEYPFPRDKDDYEYSCLFYNSEQVRIDSEGNLWGLINNYSGTRICKFNPANPFPQTLDTYFLATDMAIDHHGNIWLALAGAYIAKITPGHFYKNDLTGVEILRINGKTIPLSPFETKIEIGPDNTVWVLVDQSKLYSFDGFTWVLHEVNADEILAFSVAPTGKVWVGTPGALQEYNGQKWKSHPRTCITPTEILAGQHNTVWFISGWNGVYKYDKVDWSFFSAEKVFDDVAPLRILPAPDGALWFTNYSRWYRFQPN